jgi:hypothetical protein
MPADRIFLSSVNVAIVLKPSALMDSKIDEKTNNSTSVNPDSREVPLVKECRKRDVEGFMMVAFVVFSLT